MTNEATLKIEETTKRKLIIIISFLFVYIKAKFKRWLGKATFFEQIVKEKTQ